MDFSRLELTAEQQQFAKEARAFFEEYVTDEIRAESHRSGDGFTESVHLALGARGWLMPAWPVEHGGAGLDAVCVRILELEMARSRYVDIPIGTTRLVWSAVEKYLDPELMAELRPQVASGHVRFCLGYTDPDGGSDIANSKLRAVQDGDEWVLNGSKIFTTGAHQTQYTFLITRTDPDLPKHKGLTMFLVDLSTPGVEIQGIHTFGDERTNVVYYGDVRISDRYRMGGVNAGWAVLHGPLDAEHSIGEETSGLDDISIGRSFLRHLELALDSAAEWATTAKRPDGSLAAQDSSVRLRLGKVATEVEAGISTPGPMGRVLGSEALVRGSAELIDLVGPSALLNPGADGATGSGSIDHAHRFAQGTATYGGTVEVFRNIIAQHVLGLPQMDFPGRKVYLPGKRNEAGRSNPARAGSSM
ncbi:acyl-CoA dehydrogenase family protein [Jatrophihabitans sp. DSM 45814]